MAQLIGIQLFWYISMCKWNINVVSIASGTLISNKWDGLSEQTKKKQI